jgi:crotonobetaine/carnitine-CoA ligase
VKAGYGQTETGNPITGLIHGNPGGTPKDLWTGKAADDIVADIEVLGIPVVDDAPAERFIRQEMPFVEVAVLNEDDERVAPGETGELAVRPNQPAPCPPR